MNQASQLFEQFPQWFSPGRPLKLLDLSCSNGRNGHWFLKRGHRVTFLDLNLSALPADICQHPLASVRLQDLERGTQPDLGQFELLLVFNYLHRPLLPLIKQAVIPGGLLVYETFSWQQARIGRPKNPEFLLQEKELITSFAEWNCLYYGEDTPETPGGRSAFKARIICRKPTD